MTTVSRVAAGCAASPSHTSASARILHAARLLLSDFERGRRIDASVLRSAMETAFGASDAAGAWEWKTAYDACEAATVLFLRKYGMALFRKADSPASRLVALAKIAGLLPSHTRRSEESQALQQFLRKLQRRQNHVSMSGAQMNEFIAKRLALTMALMCVRNTCIEDIHAGVEPSSEAGDFSDVKVVTLSAKSPGIIFRVSAMMMREFMKQVVDRLYTVLLRLDDPEFVGRMDRYARRATARWDEPRYLTDWFSA